ncbi:uncharacterized protein [Diadema setosum]|uniref:uncharacterized protein n=1 Tax=Diadema setosum TaxID=31175 RepID=UPI003B3B1FA2
MGENFMMICLVVLLSEHHSGQCMSSMSTPTRASCHTQCTYLKGTREADCDYRQLSEVPMECDAASYLSLSHNQIERIEPGTFEGFSDLEVLILSYNKIRQVEANAFTGAPKLKRIDLQSNNLAIFDSLALNGSGDLEHIYLSYNNINDIATDTFQYVTKLVLIALYNNSLPSLNPSVFDNLRHLKILDLGCNKLKILPSNIFAHLSRLETIILSENQLISTGRILLLPRITTLDLHNNNLTRLEHLTEETLGRLDVFLIEGNPWKCDCQLESLRLWYSRLNSQEDHGVYVDSPTCHEPPSLAKLPINGGQEGFCPTLDFSFSTDSSKSTKESFHEISSFTVTYPNKPMFNGKSYLKVIIVPVIFAILAIMLVYVICSKLKHKRKRNIGCYVKLDTTTIDEGRHSDVTYSTPKMSK